MTLGQYRDLFAALAGEHSKAVAFLDQKIAEQGRDEPVLADESQMIKLLAGIDKNVAYIIAKLLSEQWDDADAMLRDFAAMIRKTQS